MLADHVGRYWTLGGLGGEVDHELRLIAVVDRSSQLDGEIDGHQLAAVAREVAVHLELVSQRRPVGFEVVKELFARLADLAGAVDAPGHCHIDGAGHHRLRHVATAVGNLRLAVGPGVQVHPRNEMRPLGSHPWQPTHPAESPRKAACLAIRRTAPRKQQRPILSG